MIRTAKFPCRNFDRSRREAFKRAKGRIVVRGECPARPLTACRLSPILCHPRFPCSQRFCPHYPENCGSHSSQENRQVDSSTRPNQRRYRQPPGEERYRSRHRFGKDVRHRGEDERLRHRRPVQPPFLIPRQSDSASRERWRDRRAHPGPPNARQKLPIPGCRCRCSEPHRVKRR